MKTSDRRFQISSSCWGKKSLRTNNNLLFFEQLSLYLHLGVLVVYVYERRYSFITVPLLWPKLLQNRQAWSQAWPCRVVGWGFDKYRQFFLLLLQPPWLRSFAREKIKSCKIASICRILTLLLRKKHFILFVVVFVVKPLLNCIKIIAAPRATKRSPKYGETLIRHLWLPFWNKNRLLFEFEGLQATLIRHLRLSSILEPWPRAKQKNYRY